MTKLEIFLKLFPEATLDGNGVPNVLPCHFGECKHQTEFGCGYECKDGYWDEEVEL